MPVNPLPQKYSDFQKSQISLYRSRPVPFQRGVSRTSRGRRDGMRWTLWRARRAMPKWTAKSCGPDTPKAGVQACGQSRGRRWQKCKAHRGEREATVNHRAGNAGCFRCNRGALRACFFATGASAPGIPAPSDRRVRKNSSKARANDAARTNLLI